MALTWLDALADGLCLAMMMRVLGRRINPLRLAAAAVLGAAAAQWVRLCGFSRPQTAVLWLPLAYMLARLAGGGRGIRPALVLLGCAGLLGGTIGALGSALLSPAAAWGTGAAAAAWMALSAVRARRMARSVYTVRIAITIGGRSAQLEALVDSGNCLRDYLTHRPVIVLPQAAKARFGLEGQALRPIFADTAGGRQMMECVTPARTLIGVQGRWLQADACAAFSPGLTAAAPALLPQALLDERI